VLARIWLLLALLMLAAPAGDVVAEAAEASSYAAADDDTATGATAVVLDEFAPRVVHIPRVAETTRPAPALARVFRPPRPTFD
jgi:hypothetical protein